MLPIGSTLLSSPDGLENPTPHVRPGDHLIVNLTPRHPLRCSSNYAGKSQEPRRRKDYWGIASSNIWQPCDHTGRMTISARPLSGSTVYLSCAPSLTPPLVVSVLTPNVWNDCFFVSPILTGGNTKVNLRKCSVPPRISIGPNITLIREPSGPLWTSILSLKNVKLPSGPL